MTVVLLYIINPHFYSDLTSVLNNNFTVMLFLCSDVTFSFGEPVYSFDENMGNATVTVKKVNGSIVQAITLTVSGCKFSKVSSSQELKFHLYKLIAKCS